MASITDRYAIVGVGESERSKNSGKSPLRMAVEASRDAMAEAGLGPSDIDCILSYQHSDSCDGHSLGNASRHPADLLHGRVRRRIEHRDAGRHAPSALSRPVSARPR